MIEIIKILKDGSIKNININIETDFDILYKKCSFRKNDNFCNIYTIKFKKYNFEIWGKSKGNNNEKNIYNFNNIFSNIIYGNCLVLLKENNTYINFNFNMWQKLFNTSNNVDNNKSNNNYENDSEDEDIENLSQELTKEQYIYTSDEDN
jgi:hypothetical protein